MKTHGHRRVAEEAGIPRLAQALHTFGIPENAYPSGLDAFYLGNWLTDCSQFKDPGGFLASKPDMLKDFLIDIGDSCSIKLKGVVFDYVSTLDISEEKANALRNELGRTIDKAQYSYRGSLDKLRDWVIRNIDQFLWHLVRFSAYSKFVHPLPGKTQKRINFSTFLKIYDRRYGQYFPHEHLDRPPCKYTLEEYCDKEGWLPFIGQSPDLLYANRVNPELGIYRYLEGSIKTAIRTFYELDKQWASKYLKATPRTPDFASEEWSLGLADLGYALHTIEDFFAHSNFMENVATMQGQDYLIERVYDKNLLSKAALGRPLRETELLKIRKSYDAVRKIRKRLKKYFPDVDKKYEKVMTVDDDKHIVTGYFDGQDALVAVLQFVMEQLRREKKEDENILQEFLRETFEDIFEYEIKIYQELTNESLLGKVDKKNEVFREYLKELKKDKVQKIKEKKNVEPPIIKDILFVASAILDLIIELSQVILILSYLIIRLVEILIAISVLKPVEKLIPKTIKDKANDIVFKVLPLFLGKKGLQYLGKELFAEEIYDLYTYLFETLGGFRIGSHSLLAKDSPGEPLYDEMFLCAKTVHWYIVDAFCRWADKQWYTRAESTAEAQWIDWDDLVFYFLRHPAKTPNVRIVRSNRVTVQSSYNYVVNEQGETLKQIYRLKVNPLDFSYDAFLFFNSIDLSYVYDPIGGMNIDEEKLKNQIVMKGMAIPTDHSYYIRLGYPIMIPFLAICNLPKLLNTTWYSVITNLEAGQWNDFILKYQRDRDIMSQPENQLYTWKYVQEEDVDRNIQEYDRLRIRLENAYNRTRHQSL